MQIATPETKTPATDAPLSMFADWLRETDDHSGHHLALVEQVERALEVFDGATDESLELAEKLERWRRQHFRHARFPLSSQDQTFVDALESTARQLAGRPPLPPRRTYQTIGGDSLPSDSLAEAAGAMEPGYPLEKLIGRAQQITEEHFGTIGSERSTGTQQRRMLMYAPVYVSSLCASDCTYCGFSFSLDIERKHLSLGESMEQVDLLQKEGFGHLLIVSGDFPSQTTSDYYCDIARAMVREGIATAIEVASQPIRSYEALAASGVCGVTLYQETYDEQLYAKYHVRGPKADYHWRLEALDRAAEAGIERLGLGVLLGLADEREDVLALIRHGEYLQGRFPNCTFAFSLPRLHEAPDSFTIQYPITDEDLIRLYCVLRIAFPQAELVLSTRESQSLRDRMSQICITQMSAGSSTVPGGYGPDPATAAEQFPTTDNRSPAEVAKHLEQAGFRVAWSMEAC